MAHGSWARREASVAPYQVGSALYVARAKEPDVQQAPVVGIRSQSQAHGIS